MLYLRSNATLRFLAALAGETVVNQKNRTVGNASLLVSLESCPTARYMSHMIFVCVFK